MILCERGIRTFETYTRNTLDLAAVPLVHHLTHLPVIVDPSHATGKRWLVTPLAIGGVAVGRRRRHGRGPSATPTTALSDAEQQLTLDQFRDDDGRARAGPRAWSASRRRQPDRRRVRRHGGGLVEALSAMTAPDPMSPSITRRRAAARRLRLPGDKSISHRALMLARLAAGESRIEARRRRRGRALDGRRSSGRSGRPSSGSASDGRTVDYRVVSPGADGLRDPAATLDCGNSGTSLRLIAGMLAGPALHEHAGRRRFVASASGRSYHRTAASDGRDARRPAERLPPAADSDRSIAARGHRPCDAGTQRAGEVGGPAGRASGGRPDDGHARPSRRAITPSGCSGHAASPVERDGGRPTGRVELDGARRAAVQAIDERVPGDVVRGRVLARRAGSIHPDAELVLHDVGVNPTRRAVIDLLRRMGADIEETAGPAAGGRAASASRSRTSCVRSAALHGDRYRPRRRRRGDRRDPGPVPGRGAWPTGTTTIRGAGELRHKESDRIAGIAAGLARARRATSRSTATTSGSTAARACAGPPPTASTTTAWR